jgi:glycosyltransferase involved in cell wall biosynthesis
LAKAQAPVSAVIPCFQCAGTIARAVDSVLSQSAPPAEIFVVDDASNDGSSAALVGLGVAVRTIRLAQNRGPSGARNAGWQAATQPYVAFLDADDAWHVRKIELQLAWMESHPQALLTGHRIHEHKLDEPSVSSIDSATRVSPLMLLAANRFQTSSVMLRRSLSQRFAEDKRYCEDYLLWLQIVLGGGEAHYLDAPLATRFKAAYGAYGASGRLWAMERGELDALRRVWRAGLLGFSTFAAAVTWSGMKFLRRAALAQLR